MWRQSPQSQYQTNTELDEDELYNISYTKRYQTSDRRNSNEETSVLLGFLTESRNSAKKEEENSLIQMEEQIAREEKQKMDPAYFQ